MKDKKEVEIKNHKHYRPYQRHKLNDINAHGEVENGDEFKAVDKTANNWGHWDRVKLNRAYIERIVQKFVNRPYDDFMKFFHNRTLYARAKGINVDYLIPISTHADTRRYAPYGSEEYYVDDNGLIRKNPDAYKNHKKEHAPVIVNETNIKYVYKIQPKALKACPQLYTYLKRFMSIDCFMDICEDEISEVAFKRAKKSFEECGGPQKLRKLLKSDYDSYFNFWNGFDSWSIKFEKLFYRHKYSDKTEYEYGTYQYARVKAEERKANAKKIREYKKEKEEREAELLKTIETARIEEQRRKDYKESLTDEQKRDRHGFDDNSFKGEEYHGQKRKKK